MRVNKHRISYFLAFGIMLSAATRLQAQEQRKMSLDEAIKLGINNSGKIKIDNARVDEALSALHEARNSRLPDVKASGAYLRVSNPDVNLKVKLGGSDTSKQSSSKPIKVDQAAYGIVSASLPIFSGLRIKYGVESAKFLEKAARLDAAHNKEEVVQNIISAYANLYKASKSVDLVKENLARERQRVTDFGNLEKNGLLARNDLLKAELQESNVELSLLDAENNRKLSCINMNLILGLPETTELLPDSSSFAAIPDAGSATQWEQTAFQHRKDMASLALKEKAADAMIKSAKGEYYPGLALTGGYIAADVPDLLTITNALNIGVGLQYNLGAFWKAGAKIAGAKARYHELQATAGILSDQVRLEINQAYENYMLSLRKIDVYQKAIEQANENYRITRNKYDNNLVTTTELLEADVAQLQAQLNYSFSRSDATVAYYKLQQTAGILSDTYHLN